MLMLKIAGLEIEVYKREFPDADDYWDGNWIDVSARCIAPGSQASTRGAILHLPELATWLKALNHMNEKLSGRASLKPMEPNLAVTLSMNATGQIEITVDITPDHMSQSHQFIFKADQTMLAPLIGQLEAVLKEYPIQGK